MSETRVRLVDSVLASLGHPGPFSDAWKAELDRREDEFQRDEVELIDNADVFAQLRTRLRGAYLVDRCR